MSAENELISFASPCEAHENELISTDDPLVETVHYRDLSIPVWRSLEGGFYYTVLAGRTLRIDGDYRRSLLGSIDDFIGTWESWPKLNAKLVEFPNPIHLDLKLVVAGRIIKVYLIEDHNKVERAHVIEMAESDLMKYLKAI